MKVRYSKQALEQVESALTYVLERSPAGADNIRRQILEDEIVLLRFRHTARRPLS